MKEFKVRKAAQVAAYFALAEGGSINVLKLVKLIYLADRKFMELYDSPILNDKLVSMDHGPVNSVTFDYINGCENKRTEWDAYIKDREGHIVILSDAKISVADLDELSRAELKVLEEVWSQFKGWDGFQVRDYTHKYCLEWENPNGSSAPIPYERVFKFLGKENFSILAANIESERQIDRLFANG
ncbi:MAG: DUF4065 domain-containing protein [Alphaproteobacteria bacterium]|nr:DUF4065 domain-containing protein [Alphaproteobacteria bacterium]